MSVLNLWQIRLLASTTMCRMSHIDIPAEYLTNCNWCTINSSTQTANQLRFLHTTEPVSSQFRYPYEI